MIVYRLATKHLPVGAPVGIAAMRTLIVLLKVSSPEWACWLSLLTDSMKMQTCRRKAKTQNL